MNTKSELPDRLIESARETRENAYAPHTGVKIGASVLTAEDERVFSACNIDTAPYGITLCAERTAIGKAVSEGYRSFSAILIYSGKPDFVYPCGICREILIEFDPETVILANRHGDIRELTPEQLLPGRRESRSMNKKEELTNDG